MRLDPTLGGVKGDGTVTSEVNDDDPNQNSFGLYLLSGMYETLDRSPNLLLLQERVAVRPSMLRFHASY